MLNLARKGNKIRAVFERLTIEHRKLTQHDASLVGVGAHQRCHGVNDIKQEVRVDLALQRLELHAGGKLFLLFKLQGGNLRGKQLAKAFSNGNLRFGNARRLGIVELQRTLNGRPHLQGNDNGGLDGAHGNRQTHFKLRAQHTGFAILHSALRASRADMPAQFTQLFPASASIAQNHFAVGDGNSACRSGREQYLAHLLGSFRREAFLHGFQRCACQVQHRHRLVCADAVGVKDQGNGNKQERRKQSARNGEHQIVGFRAEHSPAQNTAADERHAQRSNFKKNGDVVARVGHKRSSGKRELLPPAPYTLQVM